MMRRAFLSVLFAAAPLAVSGCASSGPPQMTDTAVRPPSDRARVDLSGAVCKVLDKMAIVNWKDYHPSGSDPKKISWDRIGTTLPRITFHLKNPEDKKIFPGFEGAMGRAQITRDSGPQRKTPDWDADGDSDSDGYTFGYKVQSQGKECDPEICIRKDGNGCGGYVDQ